MYASKQVFFSVFYKLKKNPQTFTSGSFTELFQKYKDSTVPQSEAGVFAVYKLNFLYFWDLNILQTLTKPCHPFVENREFLNPFSADKDRQAMYIQWRQIRKKVWESCCRFSLSPGAEKLTVLAQNIIVVIHYYTETKLFCYYLCWDSWQLDPFFKTSNLVIYDNTVK